MSSQTRDFPPTVREYILNTGMREHPVLIELRNVTRTCTQAEMQISPEQGQLMALLARLIKARRTIEVGVFTGYSALSVAMALPETGEMIACDINKQYTDTARAFWTQAGCSQKIKLYLAPASETLAKLIEQKQHNQFDMAFIDADKTGYDTYYEQCLQLIRPGGLILVDNVLWGGSVADDDKNDPDTLAIKALNQKIHKDNRVDMLLLPVGDGLTIVTKRDA
ncbi:O-methyltransferase [Microbulbifer sp. 2205BS26-8]|uniref:O-methyltransferase n=1 Tax=Microbulbifer sp. 2205BS26-8 TaxID=3064386 RepID=UPI00273DB15E|nr:class I SAM-dependent methyltransferase [Microbulbifer sp. 2205BS26-8]MDP5208211.1 class I SAM-dependent methyltransferase [Microbulbifer sp. 2205BS26-8]